MKVIAVIMADLEHSWLGTRARLADELGGEPILRRTVERLARCRNLSGLHVVTRPEQAARVARILDGMRARVETAAELRAPYAELVRAGRIWGLDGWRGGIGAACAFDEETHVPVAHALAEREQADAVVPVSGASVLVNPGLIDALIAQHRTYADEHKMTLVQAPPGLATIVLARSLLGELAPTGMAPGALLAYRPNQPMADLTGKEMCHRPPASVIGARGRLICDTRRSRDRAAQAIADGAEDWDAPTIGAWLTRRLTAHVDSVPEEIEIELCADELKFASTSPGAPPVHAPSRGPMDLSVVEWLCRAIEGWDDVRIVLGGCGDPCDHPELDAVCRMLRAAGAAAIAVRTRAAWEGRAGDVANPRDDAIERALFETPVDVIEVDLSATTADTYRRVHGRDDFERVRARVDRWCARRIERRAVLPLVVPAFTKRVDNLHEMEAFYDEWTGREGVARITGHAHCAGQLPRRAVTTVAPPDRGACRRVFSRTVILADGRMTTCDQDVAGRQTVGSILDTPFEILWRSERLESIRQNEIAATPLCPACEEWHRP